MKDEQAGILHAFAFGGHVRDVVDGLVDAGVGVEVLSELHAHAFKPCDEFVAGEVLGAVEAHVLQEVGQTALVVVLKNRAYLLSDVEVGLPFGRFVVTDEVSKSVG